MGKAKQRRKLAGGPSGPKHAAGKPSKPSKANNSNKPGPKPGPKPAQKQQHHANQAPTIPFSPLDRILVLGDGDLSFSRSLVTHHGCASLLATTFDSHSELVAKYPQAQENIEVIEAEEQKVLHGVDATKLVQKEIKKSKEGREGWERIVFNFPHVGGKSTDVNRQVRYNQEMLVSFFRAATPLLATHGTIIVTLFEGEPYTLWNIRDLARHAGLEVQKSFKFHADVYPGYAHARTLGNIEGGGGWKGENRSARSYVFQKKGAEEAVRVDEVNKAAKRKKGEDSEDSDGD